MDGGWFYCAVKLKEEWLPVPDLCTGGWRRIQTVLPEHVDDLPQGAAGLRFPGWIPLFHPPPGHTCGARRRVARHQSIRPVHQQLVRLSSFPLSSAVKQRYEGHADADLKLKAQRFPKFLPPADRQYADLMFNWPPRCDAELIYQQTSSRVKLNAERNSHILC